MVVRLLMVMALAMTSGCTYRVISHPGNLTRESLLQELPRRPLKAVVVVDGFSGTSNREVEKSLLSSGMFSSVSFGKVGSDTDVVITLQKTTCWDRESITQSAAGVYFVAMPWTIAVGIPTLFSVPAPFPSHWRCWITMEYHFPGASDAKDRHRKRYLYDYVVKEYAATFTYRLFTSPAREQYQAERLYDQAFAGMLAKLKADAVVLEK